MQVKFVKIPEVFYPFDKQKINILISLTDFFKVIKIDNLYYSAYKTPSHFCFGNICPLLASYRDNINITVDFACECS